MLSVQLPGSCLQGCLLGLEHRLYLSSAQTGRGKDGEVCATACNLPAPNHLSRRRGRGGQAGARTALYAPSTASFVRENAKLLQSLCPSSPCCSSFPIPAHPLPLLQPLSQLFLFRLSLPLSLAPSPPGQLTVLSAAHLRLLQQLLHKLAGGCRGCGMLVNLSCPRLHRRCAAGRRGSTSEAHTCQVQGVQRAKHRAEGCHGTLAVIDAWKRLKTAVPASNHAVIVFRCGAGRCVYMAEGLLAGLAQACCTYLLGCRSGQQTGRGGGRKWSPAQHGVKGERSRGIC